MRVENRIRALSALAVFLLTSSALWAAIAKVEGVVVDPAEQPLAGAVVTVVADDGSAQETDTTNRKGKFALTFRDYAPGAYEFVEAITLRLQAGPDPDLGVDTSVRLMNPPGALP